MPLGRLIKESITLIIRDKDEFIRAIICASSPRRTDILFEAHAAFKCHSG
jgi:hypothetical protein